MLNDFRMLEQLQNINIEENILGAIFEDNNLIDRITENLFVSSNNKKMVRAFKDLRNQGKDIDIFVFLDYINRNKIDIPISNINDIHSKFLTLVNIDTHLEILKDLSIKRSIYLTTNKIDYIKSNTEIINELSKLCEQVYSNNITKENTKDFYNEYLVDLYSNQQEPHIKTSLSSLDNDIVGFLNGQLITISAYTGMGKSILTSQLILNILKQNKKIDLFSLEMGKQEIINKLVSNACNIQFNKIYKKDLNDTEKDKIKNFISNFLYDRDLEIYDTIGDIDNIVSTIKKDNLKGKVDIVFIDLINRVSNRQGNNKNRAEYLGELTRRLKLLALELKIPIVITCQINRNVEAKQDKRPTLADIKESGGIAEDSDLVIGLYRNKDLEREEIREELERSGKLNYNSPNANLNPNAIELLLLKGRNVMTDNYSFNWDGKYQRISNLG